MEVKSSMDKSVNKTFQKLFIAGRLAADPTFKVINEKNCVVNFGVVVNEGSNSDYIPCVAWGERAKEIAENLVKGDLVQFDGKLKSSTFKDTEKRDVFRIQVEVLKDGILNFLEYNRHSKKELKSEGEL